MIEIKEENLKQGVLGLVIALVEVIRDALKHQALRRVESNRLCDEEVERLGKAMMELDTAIDEIKLDMGLNEAVQSVRDGLDDLANDLVETLVDPRKWQQAERRAEGGPQPSHPRVPRPHSSGHATRPLLKEEFA